MTEWSAAQILGAISAALRARDMQAVVELLHMLAVVSPVDAELILAVVMIGPEKLEPCESPVRPV